MLCCIQCVHYTLEASRICPGRGRVAWRDSTHLPASFPLFSLPGFFLHLPVTAGISPTPSRLSWCSEIELGSIHCGERERWHRDESGVASSRVHQRRHERPLWVMTRTICLGARPGPGGGGGGGPEGRINGQIILKAEMSIERLYIDWGLNGDGLRFWNRTQKGLAYPCRLIWKTIALIFFTFSTVNTVNYVNPCNAMGRGILVYLYYGLYCYI